MLKTFIDEKQQQQQKKAKKAWALITAKRNLSKNVMQMKVELSKFIIYVLCCNSLSMK